MSKKPKPWSNPDAGHQLLQKLINSIEIVECESVPVACWNYAFMYDARDALNASQARCTALEAMLEKIIAADDEAFAELRSIGLDVPADESGARTLTEEARTLLRP